MIRRDLEMVPPEQWYPKQVQKPRARYCPCDACADATTQELLDAHRGFTITTQAFDTSRPTEPGPRPLIPSLQEQNIRLRLALTQARDTLERYRDPLVRVLDGVLAE
jgi:hypothetical protein